MISRYIYRNKENGEIDISSWPGEQGQVLARLDIQCIWYTCIYVWHTIMQQIYKKIFFFAQTKLLKWQCSYTTCIFKLIFLSLHFSLLCHKRNFSNKYEKIVERITYTFNYIYVVLFCSSMIRMLAYIRKFGNGWVHVRSVFAIMRTIAV